MTEQSKGLRFDIYERIHLADDAIGVSELHEAELIPHIQVIAQDEQALLRGNLLLTGQYVSEGTNDKRTLEHLIPVEITLPMSRINSLSDILVEIENFDVELLSTRNLNVTGVLSLHGVEVPSDLTLHAAHETPYEQNADGSDLSFHDPWSAEEEMTFSHQASEAHPFADVPQPVEIRPEAEIRAADLPQPLQANHLWQQQIHEVIEPEVAYPKAYMEQKNAYTTSYVAPNYVYEEVRHHEVNDEHDEFDEVNELDEVNEPNEPNEPNEVNEVEQQDEFNQLSPQFAAPVIPVQEEVKEMKIALGSRSKEEPFVDEQTVGIKSLLRPSNYSDQDANSGSQSGAGQETLRTDSVEWRKLFLREDADNQQFRRVKMCIIQKEETLEGIARKYGVNERELQQFNKLPAVDVQTGQIIYIPR